MKNIDYIPFLRYISLHLEDLPLSGCVSSFCPQQKTSEFKTRAAVVRARVTKIIAIFELTILQISEKYNILVLSTYYFNIKWDLKVWVKTVEVRTTVVCRCSNLVIIKTTVSASTPVPTYGPRPQSLHCSKLSSLTNLQVEPADQVLSSLIWNKKV